MRKKTLKRLLIGGLLCAAVSMAPSRADAAIITLQDQNTTINIDPDTDMGMKDWVVDGVEHLFQQWFWYRIGSGPGTFEQAINTISAAATIVANTNFNPGNDTATVHYENATLIVEVKYSLLGGGVGSGNSDLGEQILVSNKTNQPLDLHLFQYSDFDVNGTPGGDLVTMLNPNSVRQYDIGGGPSAGEAVSLPFSNHHEVDVYANTLGKLNDGDDDTLTDTNSAGPGDVTFAFQWDITLNPVDQSGHSFLISKNKNIYVPEPASLVLFGMGLIGAAGVARRRKAVVPQA